ncbi:FliI/YscN family ATPase [Niveibacterium sp. COAC-50]|uniref:FliI/YscN family ATPase n=1 Tax=Niveibacterium sp. COAC-50 TaxID=2729384 RepID=UPI001558241F
MNSPLVRALREAELIVRRGRVAEGRGYFLEADGPAASVGEVCRVEPSGRDLPVTCEVVGFRGGRVLMMPYHDTDGIHVGAPVIATGKRFEVGLGDGLLGRVVDAFGEPLDGKGPIAHTARRPERAAAPNPMRRARITEPLVTGIRSIDALLPLGKGQRVGLFAGSGVGKSTLLGQLAKGSSAEVCVIALIGERGREVREFVEDHLGEEGARRACVVAATSDTPALQRIKAAYVATTIAEYFRDQGRDVLLLMDSLTRLALARREIGLAVGEAPTSRGYTPSVFAEIPELCERSGMGEGRGSITALYTVLVEGDDLNEPISDAIRATLDGHVVLSRALANAGHYPAIDPLTSISRLVSQIASSEHRKIAARTLALLAHYERNRQLIEVGAYRAGVSRELDEAVALAPRIRAWLTQRETIHATLEEAFRALAALLGTNAT